MNRTQTLNVLLLAFCLGLPGWAEATEMSFGQALERLESSNESLQAARAEMERCRYRRAAARGLYFPTLDLASRYTRIDEPITIDLNAIREVILGLHPQAPSQAVPAFEEPVQGEVFWRANATLSWPVFTGGRIRAANRAAEAILSESREKLRATYGGLVSELVRRYFGLRLAREVAEVRRRVLLSLDAHLAQARALEDNGVIARGERLHATVARAEADRQHKSAVHDLRIASTTLKQILSLDEPVEPTTPLLPVESVGSMEDFVRVASERNHMIRQIVARRDQAHQGYRKEVGTFYPEIFLFGNREVYTGDLTLLDPGWAVGVGARFTLFDGRARVNKLKAARTVEKQLSLLERDARRKVEALVELRYQELMKGRERLEVLATATEFAEELLRVRTRAFEEGVGTSLEIVDARLALSRVQIERLVAARDCGVALARLLEASGQSERLRAFLGHPDREGDR